MGIEAEGYRLRHSRCLRLYGVKRKRTVRNSSSIFKVFVLGSRLAFRTAFSAPFLTWQAAAQYYHSRLALGFSFLSALAVHPSAGALRHHFSARSAGYSASGAL